MMRRNGLLTLGVALISSLATGCGSSTTSNTAAPPPGPNPAVNQPITFPELGPSQQVAPGVQMHEVTLGTGALAGKVWVYLPKPAPAEKLPCILIAPAGTPLIHGMDLGQGDQAEHLPYIKAGFAVVAYAIAGPLAGDFNPNKPQDLEAVRTFMQAEGGVVNARWALDFALDKVPQIDPKRIYTAGHSSAATLSLQVAQNEPRIKACIAYAPVSDLSARLGGNVQVLNRAVPGFADFVNRVSPVNHADQLKCPLFLFHAQDDTNVKINESARFADEVKKTNTDVNFVKAPRGGHYNSMVQQGIPQAIQWLKKLPS
jgi:dipeptidyl aminopeptidase/acylaminoacyl peptidase